MLLPLVAVITLAACDEPATSPLAVADESLARGAEPTRVYDLGTLGGARSYAWDINDAGVVVGTSETADGQQRAFRWTAQRGMEELATLGGVASGAVGINKGGFIVGTSLDGAGTSHLVMWKPNGEIVDLGVYEDQGPITPIDINDHNQIVGEFFPYASEMQGHVFYWTPKLGFGTFPWAVDLLRVGAVNNQGDVVGGFCCGTAQDLSGVFFIPRGREFVDLGGGIGNYSAAAADINNHRVIVGWNESDDAAEDDWGIAPFRWTPKKGFELLRGPNGIWYGYATAVNDRGEIVGGLGDGTAFHWADEVGLVSLGPGYVAAINQRFQIVGANGSRATLWVGTKGFPVATARSGPLTVRQVETSQSGCFTDMETVRSRASLLRCLASTDK